MIRRIVLENYMSHAHSVIEPADGLTVLIGPNNCGKSALVSALQTLACNLTGDYMVRHGERETSVTVETDDGHTIAWRRKGSTVSYVVDGEEIHRLRGGTPERLDEWLRLPRVKSEEGGDDEFDIHFGTQKAPIFLLNESERRAAMFFAASSDAAKLLQMQKRHCEKVKDSKRERDGLAEDLVRLDAELRALAPIGDLATRLQLAEQQHESLCTLGEQLDRLSSELKALERERADVARRQAELDVLDPLDRPPDFAAVAPLESLIESTEAAGRRVAARSHEIAVLAPLCEPPALADVAGVAGLCEALAAESASGIVSAALVASLARLQSVPEFENAAALEQLVRNLDDERRGCGRQAALHRTLDRLQPTPQLAATMQLEDFVCEFERLAEVSAREARSHRALSKMTLPPAEADCSPLAQIIGQLEAERVRVGDQLEAVGKIEQARAAVEREIRAWARDNPICRTCGAAIDAERLMEGEHAHD